MCDLARVAGSEPHMLHALGHAAWVVSVIFRPCTAPQNGRLGSRCHSYYIDRDMSDVYTIRRQPASAVSLLQKTPASCEILL